MNQNHKKFVFITGAGTGIGKACALMLDQHHFHVIAGVRNLELGKVLKSVASERLSVLELDITQSDSLVLAQETIKEWVKEQGLYGLINNAGVAILGPMEALSMGDLRTQLEVNVLGQIATTQSLLPWIRLGKGRIINMGSVLGELTLPYSGAYCASKAALEAVTDALRMELKPWDIPVILVAPGSIQTPIWEKSLRLADTMAEKLPETAQILYQELYQERLLSVRKTSQKMASRGLSPEKVAQVVLEALRAKKPRAIYRVGWDAYLGSLLGILPERWRDLIVLNNMQL